jgi:hypothetical protein
MKTGWYGVDLDGTLAHYETYGNGEIGDPIPKMVERVKRWIAEGKEVRIFTARMSQHEDPNKQRNLEEVRNKIENWCIKHIGTKLKVTNIKDHNLIELWDDRAVGVVKNTGRRK